MRPFFLGPPGTPTAGRLPPTLDESPPPPGLKKKSVRPIHVPARPRAPSSRSPRRWMQCTGRAPTGRRHRPPPRPSPRSPTRRPSPSPGLKVGHQVTPSDSYRGGRLFILFFILFFVSEAQPHSYRRPDAHCRAHHIFHATTL